MFLDKLNKYFQSIESFKASRWLVDPFVATFSDLILYEVN